MLAFSQIAVSLANHARDLPELAHSVKYAPVPDATRDNLTAAWKAWVEQAGAHAHPRPTCLALARQFNLIPKAWSRVGWVAWC